MGHFGPVGGRGAYNAYLEGPLAPGTAGSECDHEGLAPVGKTVGASGAPVAQVHRLPHAYVNEAQVQALGAVIRSTGQQGFRSTAGPISTESSATSGLVLTPVAASTSVSADSATSGELRRPEPSGAEPLTKTGQMRASVKAGRRDYGDAISLMCPFIHFALSRSEIKQNSLFIEKMRVSKNLLT
ncbi:unnamed protein product [Protopolystoma xenopodis]|uniref:Uncharacterized protein n=1 Tax=Protopolystoma xenopodis TaxID=117903 RepID=A0A448WJK5_9PLAT|nr:unnamed protein product [Protopolystoma xenopodis]